LLVSLRDSARKWQCMQTNVISLCVATCSVGFFVCYALVL